MRALSAFSVLVLALINAPAWGGGWESSGSPVASPVRSKPADYLAYTCTITVRRTGHQDQFIYTEVLEPKHFKNGYVSIKTPSLKGHEFLAGHELLFWGQNPENEMPGSVSIRLTATLNANGRSIAKSTVYKSAPMSKGYVTTELDLEDPRERTSMSVTARCSPTQP